MTQNRATHYMTTPELYNKLLKLCEFCNCGYSDLINIFYITSFHAPNYNSVLLVDSKVKYKNRSIHLYPHLCVELKCLSELSNVPISRILDNIIDICYKKVFVYKY